MMHTNQSLEEEKSVRANRKWHPGFVFVPSSSCQQINKKPAPPYTCHILFFDRHTTLGITSDSYSIDRMMR